jgi:hypothetical protein
MEKEGIAGHSTLKTALTQFAGISIGIFLFILFFQPFPLDHFDFNNRLIFVVGFSAIVFLFMLLLRFVFNRFIQNYESSISKKMIPYYWGNIALFACGAISFTFYLRYVGHVDITFYIMSKILILNLVPPVTLYLYDLIMSNNQKIQILELENKQLNSRILIMNDEYQNLELEFVSLNKNENLRLTLSEVVYLTSSDNYVEIYFQEGTALRKQLVRNTLKNIELQLKPYTHFIRCHRTFIVNSIFIDQFKTFHGSQWLTLKGYEEKIPVSRQYILKIKEII